MRDPAGPPTWLLIAVALVWMFTLGLWVERNRFGGTKDLRDDVARIRGERDRARDELEQRRRAAMPHLTLVRGELDDASVRAVARGLRRLHRQHGSAVL